MYAVLLALAALPPQAPPPRLPPQAPRPRFWWRAALSRPVPPQAPECHPPTIPAGMFPPPVQSPALIPAGYGPYRPQFAPMMYRGSACVGGA